MFYTQLLEYMSLLVEEFDLLVSFCGSSKLVLWFVAKIQCTNSQSVLDFHALFAQYNNILYFQNYVIMINALIKDAIISRNKRKVMLYYHI